MNKLLALVAVAIATINLNAASVVWQATKGALYDGAATPAKVTSGNAYLMFVTASYTQTDLLADFIAASGDAATTLASMSSSGAMATGAGSIGASNSRPAGTSTYDLTADGTAYFVVFNGDKMYVSYTTDVLYDSVTGEATASFTTALTSISKATLDASAGYSTAGSWYAVPEPTSGLLMLVGLAGLALRRRRA